MLTVCEPGDTPKSPLWFTDTLTDSADAGAGLAVTVNMALPPSVMPVPAVMLTSGTAAGAVKPLMSKVKLPVCWS